MKACVLFEPGPPENLKVVEVRDPKPPKEGELLVKVEASGVDGHDTVTRSGVLARAVRLHDTEILENGRWETRKALILGHEIAGRVIEVGPGVTGFQVGDRVTNNVKTTCRVCEFCRYGRSNNCPNGQSVENGYAEMAIIPAGACTIIPDGVSSAAACFASCAIGTPWRGIMAGKPSFTDTILVCGAGGGLGIHALQILARTGATVLAVTTSPAKVAQLEEYGATKVVLAQEGKFDKPVMEVTRGKGADLIIDTVGGTAFNNGGFRSLAYYGRYVFVGQINDEFGRFAVPFLFWKEAILTGVSSPDYRDMQAGLDLLARGAIRPVYTSYSLDEVPQVHQLLEDRKVFGRAVIEF